MPGGYGMNNNFPKTATSVSEWLTAIGMVRRSAQKTGPSTHMEGWSSQTDGREKCVCTIRVRSHSISMPS